MNRKTILAALQNVNASRVKLGLEPIAFAHLELAKIKSAYNELMDGKPGAKKRAKLLLKK